MFVVLGGKLGRVMNHREIGKKLDLFMFDALSPGSPIWLPKGVIVYNLLLDKIRSITGEYGYEEVRTPILWKSELFKQSGHLDYYAENMFSVGDEYYLKPMNCPGHMAIFRSKQWSYKDLPVRFAEYGPLHRNEVSGSIGGLTRCRAFCQDDAHCFVTPESLLSEVSSLFEIVKQIYNSFGMPHKASLGTCPQKHIGNKETWDYAENVLKDTLNSYGEHSINEGDGAFYGPKIDFTVTDSLGREWQTATIQLDFQLPDRFGLEYIDSNNRPQRPIVIHRAIYGSFERFIGILLEHYQAQLPFWLSPTQIAILPISDRHFEYATKVKKRLLEYRVLLDDSNNTLSYKVAIAQDQKIPCMIVLGDKEEQENTVTIRNRDRQYKVDLDEIVTRLQEES